MEDSLRRNGTLLKMPRFPNFTGKAIRAIPVRKSLRKLRQVELNLLKAFPGMVQHSAVH